MLNKIHLKSIDQHQRMKSLTKINQHQDQKMKVLAIINQDPDQMKDLAIIHKNRHQRIKYSKRDRPKYRYRT